MCIIEQIGIPTWNKHFLQQYTFVVWIIGLCALLYWILELVFIRNILGCTTKRIRKLRGCRPKIPIAFLMILLSLSASFISSSMFLHSSSNPSNKTCSYAPIIAILFRYLSKHFIWGFNIVRAQMVIEMFNSKLLNILIKNSPYILSSQMIIIIGLVLMFNSSSFDENMNECTTQMPLLLIISVVFIGEILYGIGFVYIFCKAMSTSMKRVIASLGLSETQKTKKQLIHHLIVYLIQFMLSSLYIINIATCSVNNTFMIFELELLISNICILTLFRGRKRWCRKHCVCDRKQHINERRLSSYCNSNNTCGNKKSEPVLSGISTGECDEDVLDNMTPLQSIKETLTDITPKSRNNSISVNPLLPNNWLKSQYMETLRVSLVKGNVINIKSLPDFISQSDPKFNAIHDKEENGVKSRSLSLMYNKEMVNGIGVNENENKLMSISSVAKSKSNSCMLSNASKSLFKRASMLFSLNSYSTPFPMNKSTEDLASVEAISAILSDKDNKANEQIDLCLDIVYSDDEITAQK